MIEDTTFHKSFLFREDTPMLLRPKKRKVYKKLKRFKPDKPKKHIDELEGDTPDP